MATTTTTETLSILADYEIHHSGADHENESERETVNSPQLTDWPTHHRRIPAFRATNRNLSFEERPGGSNPGEMVFIQVMLHGVWLNAVCRPLHSITDARLITLYRQFLGSGGSLGAGSMIRYSTMRLEGSGKFDVQFGDDSLFLFNSILGVGITMRFIYFYT
jgi:hypothetical protein